MPPASADRPPATGGLPTPPTRSAVAVTLVSQHTNMDVLTAVTLLTVPTRIKGANGLDTHYLMNSPKARDYCLQEKDWGSGDGVPGWAPCLERGRLEFRLLTPGLCLQLRTHHSPAQALASSPSCLSPGVPSAATCVYSQEPGSSPRRPCPSLTGTLGDR